MSDIPTLSPPAPSPPPPLSPRPPRPPPPPPPDPQSRCISPIAPSQVSRKFEL